MKGWEICNNCSTMKCEGCPLAVRLPEPQRIDKILPAVVRGMAQTAQELVTAGN